MHYTLCDMIADLTQNAVEAGSSVVQLSVEETDTKLSFIIEDNGKGMDEKTLEKAKDPFYTDGVKHPKRTVGLGIPFLIQTAVETGGAWNIESQEGVGTKVTGTFDTGNIDTPPMGSIPRLFRQVIMLAASQQKNACGGVGDCEIMITRTRVSAAHPATALNYRVTKTELLDALGELETAGALRLLDEYLSGLEEPE
jgi:hypothetical protein